MIYIVGSGPAGVACAHALVSRGVPVTLLDTGIEMEPDLRQVVTTLSAQTDDRNARRDRRMVLFKAIPKSHPHRHIR